MVTLDKELVESDILFQEGLEEGEKKGKKEGLEEGEKKGEKLAKFATAKKMIKDGFPIESIQFYSGLTDTEWQEFLKNNQNI